MLIILHVCLWVLFRRNLTNWGQFESDWSRVMATNQGCIQGSLELVVYGEIVTSH